MNSKPNDLQKVIPGKHYSFRADMKFFKYNIWLLVAGLATYAGDEWFYHHRESSFVLRVIIALAPLPTLLLWIRSMSRWIRGLDEFQRRTTLQICLFAATRTLLILLVWLRLNQIGTLKAIFQPLGKGIVQHFENGALTQYCTLTGVLFFFFWWLGYSIISHRYE